ncbi:MAG TPA: HipA domain-containing protein [Mycobacteriales bacterium]|jgi:hypothetical protein|nr:HipA domain-containing protein [Mycobacteriales bacterium]
MGSKRKVWLESPTETSHLFKYLRQDSARGVYGDDWAEKLAAELARLLGIPAASVELADRSGSPGVICRRVNDPGVVELVHGNELLGARQSGYDKELKREHPLYTVTAVAGCLRDAGAPAGHPEVGALSGFDVWAGYLLFDAWIANTDRHHENWGVLIDRRDGRTRLAPSFDHGSSLGFNHAASVNSGQLAGMDAVERWCRKGRSSHFAGRPRLVDVAAEALDLAGHDAWLYWMSRLRQLRPESWNGIIEQVPSVRMSEATRTFVGRVLDVNRRRLLDVCDRAA